MKGVIMLQDGACPHVNTTVQDVLRFICWKMSDYPSYCLDHLACDFHCAVVAAAPQGVLCWEHILADVRMEFLPQDLWGLFLNSLFCHKKIPKFVSLEHTSCIYIFQCNSIDRYSKNLVTKELSLSFSWWQNSMKSSQTVSCIRWIKKFNVSEANFISIIRAMWKSRHPDDGDGVCLRNVGFYNSPMQLSGQEDFINHLTPNDHFSGCTAPLTSRCCIFYLFNKYTYWIF